MNKIIILTILALVISDVKNYFYNKDEEEEKIISEPNYNDFTLLNPNELNNSDDIPESFDWREKNIIFPKDQGSSYSTQWKLPAFEMLEILYAKEKEKLYSFSRQMIIDCLSKTNDSIEDTFDWLKNHGIMLEVDYPYKGIKSSCKIDQSKYIDMKVKGYVKLPPPEMKS